MQYRFGQQGNIAFAYPGLTTRPAEVYASGTMLFSGGGGAWLQFHNGQFSYTVFTAIGKWAPSGGPADVAGVAVSKNGDELSNIRCRGEANSEIGPRLFEELGLKSTESADEFVIPDEFFAR